MQHFDYQEQPCSYSPENAFSTEVKEVSKNSFRTWQARCLRGHAAFNEQIEAHRERRDYPPEGDAPLYQAGFVRAAASEHKPPSWLSAYEKNRSHY